MCFDELYSSAELITSSFIRRFLRMTCDERYIWDADDWAYSLCLTAVLSMKFALLRPPWGPYEMKVALF